MSVSRHAAAVSLILSMLFAVPAAWAAADASPGCLAELRFGRETVRKDNRNWSRSLLSVVRTSDRKYLPAQKIGEPLEVWPNNVLGSTYPELVEPVEQTVTALRNWLNTHPPELHVSFAGTLEKPKAIGGITMVERNDLGDELIAVLEQAGAGVDVFVQEAGEACAKCAVELYRSADWKPDEEPGKGPVCTAKAETDADGYCFIPFVENGAGLEVGRYAVQTKLPDGRRGNYSNGFHLTDLQARTGRYLVVLDRRTHDQCHHPDVIEVARHGEDTPAAPVETSERTSFRRKPELRTGGGLDLGSRDVGAFLTVDVSWETADVEPRSVSRATVYAQRKRVYSGDAWSEFMEIAADGEATQRALELTRREPRLGLSIGALVRNGKPGGLGVYYIAFPERDFRAHLIYALSGDEEGRHPWIFGVSFGLSGFKDLFPG